ncbi:MAG: hypothetical protein ACLSAF_17775 [Intestinimonas sp.]
MEQRFALDGGGSAVRPGGGAQGVHRGGAPRRRPGTVQSLPAGPGRQRSSRHDDAGEREALVRRTFSLDELRRRGAWPVLGGAAEMAFSFRGEETPPQGWSWAEGGRLELGERRLRQSASRLGRILCRRDGEGLTLACPFEPEREFPFPELFCLGRIEGFGGRRFVLFSFDGRGRPILRET